MRTKTGWHVGVAIPARNEQALLPRCLHSVLKASAALECLATVDIVVVADQSTDCTLQIATSMLGARGFSLAINAGVAGVARATACRLLIERAGGLRSMVWLANTDADCIVPGDWLVKQLALAMTGINAIAGIVTVDTFDEHGPNVPAIFKSSYMIEPGGTHPHIHGANLGIRADLYLRAGGWHPLETAEDHDLWRRLSAVDSVRRLSTSCLEVETSGRRVGRAPAGFAGSLAAHNADQSGASA